MFKLKFRASRVALILALLSLVVPGGCKARDFSGDPVKWEFVSGDGSWDSASRKWTIYLKPGDTRSAAISLSNTGSRLVIVHVVGVGPVDTIGMHLDPGSSFRLAAAQSANMTMTAVAFQDAAQGTRRYVADFGYSFNEVLTPAP